MLGLVCVVLVVVCILLCDTSGVSMCTDLSNLKHVTNGVRLTGYKYKTVAAETLMSCAQQCLQRARCKSFNLNAGQALCELNDEETKTDSLEANVGFLHSNISDFNRVIAQACSHHACSLNERCEPDGEGQHSCVAELPSSCADVRRCFPGADDGEYWIYPTKHVVRIPIYCHDMAGTPSEYITLQEPNHGVFPELSNKYCEGEKTELFDSCVGHWGEVTFTKIRLNITTFIVVQDDFTFASSTNKLNIYGVGQDCYSQHENGVRSACGPVGTFTLNLRGTAFTVASEVTWEATGWMSYAQVDRSSDNKQVDMLCGGYIGYCEPKPFLILTPNTVYGTLTDVTEAACGP